MTISVLPHARWLPVTMLIVAFIGFADATYLAMKHVTGGAVPCSITHGCGVVTSSVYSEIHGIPVAILGSIFYATVAIMTFAAMESRSRMVLRYTGYLTYIGVAASAWFVFAQVVLIKAICQWCMVSALTSTTLFILGGILLPRYLRRLHAEKPNEPKEPENCCHAGGACCEE